jgi:hypothetical protein
MFLLRNQPVSSPVPVYINNHAHGSGQQEYNAVDIGGLIDFNGITALVQQAIARLPANQQIRPGEVWGYYLKVHVTEHTAEAVIVKPYPYKTWAWR